MGGALERATKKTGRDARREDESRLPPFAVVFEDDDIVVVDKPPGLLTAPTPESDRNNLSDLLGRRPGSAGRVLVVHRIDLETSGLVVFAKTELANRELSSAFSRPRYRPRLSGGGRGGRSGHDTCNRSPGGRTARRHARRDPRALRSQGDASRLPARDGPHPPDPAAPERRGTPGDRRHPLWRPRTACGRREWRFTRPCWGSPTRVAPAGWSSKAPAGRSGGARGRASAVAAATRHPRARVAQQVGCSVTSARGSTTGVATKPRRGAAFSEVPEACRPLGRGMAIADCRNRGSQNGQLRTSESSPPRKLVGP